MRMKTSRHDASDPNTAGPLSGGRRGLKKTLLFWFLATSLVPLIMVSAISYYHATDSLQRAAHESLTNNLEEKVEFIDRWFHYRFIDLETQATSPDNARFLGELRDAFQEGDKDIESFVKSFRWNMIADEYAENLRSVRRMYDYHDIFLIDADGNILFTVAGEEDLGTNLFTGPYAETHFSKACQKALNTGRPAFADLDHYGPSEGLASSFLASVIVDEEGEKIGLFAIQLQLHEIEDAMARNAKTRAGGGGETYHVAFSDARGLTLRSPLSEDLERRQDPESNESTGYLNRRVDTEQTRLWLEQNGPSGTEAPDTLGDAFIYGGPSGERVLGIHKDVSIAGITWGVIAEIPVSKAFAPARNLGALVIVLVLITGLIVVGIAAIITSRIVRPIVQLSDAAGLVAQGDLDQRIESRATNEIGELAGSFDAMVASLREAESNQRSQDWFTTGRTGLSDQMRGEQEAAELARSIVTYLAKYLDAQIGVFYVPDDGHLKRIGGYAFRVRENTVDAIPFGEGLVGQAALEKRHIVLDNVPDDYISVRSGFVDTSPRHILVWPIVMEEEVKGVIELAGLEAFDDRCLDFLRAVDEGIGIAVDVAQSRRQLQTLAQQGRSEPLAATSQA